jgi:hypothetical protein
MQMKKAYERSRHRFAETFRHSLRDGFTVSFVLAPETGLCCLRPRCDAKHRHQVDISIGISGRHDFAVRLARARPSRQAVHRIPRPTFVTTAKRPSFGHETRRILPVICPSAQRHETAANWHDGQISPSAQNRVK